MKLLCKFFVYYYLLSASVAFAAGPQAIDQPQCSNFSNQDCMVSMAWDSLTRWADAWSDNNYQGYISSYSKAGSPQRGKSREQWLVERKRALSSAAKIKISLHMVDVQFLTENTARATVIQRYTAPHYSDVVVKTFGLGLEKGQVKIHNEYVDRNLTPLEADTIINEIGY